MRLLLMCLLLAGSLLANPFVVKKTQPAGTARRAQTVKRKKVKPVKNNKFKPPKGMKKVKTSKARKARKPAIRAKTSQ